MAVAAVAQADRTGRLLAEIHTAGNNLVGEPCELAQQLWGMTGQCQVIAAGGVQVGVVSAAAGQQFDQWAAYRHPDGVVVFVAQSLRFDESRPPLAALPLSVEQLAGIAAEDRFHLV